MNYYNYFIRIIAHRKLIIIAWKQQVFWTSIRKGLIYPEHIRFRRRRQLNVMVLFSLFLRNINVLVKTKLHLNSVCKAEWLIIENYNFGIGTCNRTIIQYTPSNWFFNSYSPYVKFICISAVHHRIVLMAPYCFENGI